MWDLQTIQKLNAETTANVDEYKQARAGDLHDEILENLYALQGSTASQYMKDEYARRAVKALDTLYKLAIK